MLVKKIAAVSMALVMSLPMIPLTASAEDSAKVFVTIADGEGKLVLTQKAVTVTDVNNDDVISIYDALYQAHEDNFAGGAKAGFEALETEYGLSLEMLWGTANGGSYGYYVNHASAWSLNDAVKDGDYIDAFCYTDSEAWSDVYCYFDVTQCETVVDDSVTLTLTCAGYDENWLPITLPVEGAVITINGKDSKYVTDADGKVTMKFSSAGTKIISARSETQKLVPPACIATVSNASNVLYGDVDKNGDIDILDVITLNKSILGKEVLSTQAEKNADADGNQKIDSNDALCILKYIVGIETELPVK